MFDFPNPPLTTGTIATAPNGAAWQWDGAKWGPVQAGGWVDAPADGNTYGRRNNAWNNVSGQMAANVGRNLFMNSEFNIQQRGAGPFPGTGWVNTADRWILWTSNDTSSVSIVSLADADRTAIGDDSALYALQYTITSSATAGSVTVCGQGIETNAFFSGKTVTLSFWARATSGTPKVGLAYDQYFGTSGSADVTANISVTPPLTATWQRYTATVAIPRVTGKTFGANEAVYFYFFLSCTTGQWLPISGNIGQQSGTVQFWGMQLEFGTVATPLERVEYVLATNKCRRFYQIANWQLFCPNANPSGNYGGAIQRVNLPVQMRAAPSVTFANISSSLWTGSTTPTYNLQSTFCDFWAVTTQVNAGAWTQGQALLTAEL